MLISFAVSSPLPPPYFLSNASTTQSARAATAAHMVTMATPRLAVQGPVSPAPALAPPLATSEWNPKRFKSRRALTILKLMTTILGFTWPLVEANRKHQSMGVA